MHTVVLTLWGKSWRHKIAEGCRGTWRRGRETIDPVEARKAALAVAQARGLTFSAATKTYLETKLERFKNAKHHHEWENALATHAEPEQGKTLVQIIETQDVLRALKPICSGKTETATRVRSRIEAVLSRATVSGHDNPEATALMFMADLGTIDPEFHAGITGQVVRIGASGAKLDESNSNLLLSVVGAVELRDALDTMLAVQMGAIHSATMMMARRLNHVENIPQQDAAERALNKLARTHAVQVEALKWHRSKGGQVIVGAVAAGGGGQKEP